MIRTKGVRAGWIATGCLVAALAAAQDDARAPVTAAAATVSSVVREVSMTGTVTSPRSAQVSTAIAGLVEQMNVDAGDRLQTGEVILVLDPALEEAAVARARAAVAQAEEELADARRRLAEAEALASQRSLPETELKSRASEVRSNEAALALRQAELRREAALLERHRVKAPFDGVISRKLTEVGEWVQPGTPVAELVATDGLRVDFRVPQEVLAQIGADSRVRVELGGLPGRWFDGRIVSTVPVSDATARTFLMRVTLEEAEDVIAPGMSANGRLAVQAGRRGVVLPRDALLRYPDGRVVVWVIGEDSTVSERVVETGLGFSDQVEIVHGVEAGERVVLQGNEMLREGQPVLVRDGRG